MKTPLSLITRALPTKLPVLLFSAAVATAGLQAATPTATPKPNVITFTTFPSDTTYKTNGLPVAATATAGTPSITVSGPGSYNASAKTIVLSGVGVVSVTASEATAPTGYVKPTPVTRTFSVSQASQTIAPFATIAPVAWGTNPPVITVPIPRASSGLPVTLSVVSGGTLSSSNKVTPTGVGTVVVAANQAGNANYLPATAVQTSIVVNQGSNSLTAFGATTPAAPVYGSSFTIAVPKGKSGAPVEVTASGASVSVSGTVATITPNAAGSVTLYANQAGTANWTAAAQVSKVVSVAKKTPTITPSGNVSTTFATNVATITVKPTSPSSGAFTFSATGSGKVDPATGVVTVTGAGSIVVKATQAASADGNYAPVTNPVTVSTITVAKGTQTLTPPVIPTPANGTSFYLPALNTAQGLACSYTVTGATYSAAYRKVTVTAPGTLSISASQAGNANYLPVSLVHVVTFKVTRAGTGYAFSQM